MGFKKRLLLKVLALACFTGPLSTISLFAQDTLRARKTLEYLAGEKLKGRGYLLHGDRKAARFVKARFSESGLKPIKGTYDQPFTISQNLFPKEPRMLVNDRPLKAGVHFIPVPGCTSVSGRFALRHMDSLALDSAIKTTVQVRKNEAWSIPSRLKRWVLKQPEFRKTRPPMLLWKENKLTHSLSENQEAFSDFVIRSHLLFDSDSVVTIEVTAKASRQVHTQNVVGIVPGTLYPDSFLVLCAHYDHLGTLGSKVYFPGASDNASGTSMLLEMASYFSKNPLKFSLVFIAFSAEEAGLLGSQYFVNHPLVPLSRIKFVMNMDLMGFGEKGATVVNATIHPEEFKRLTEINTTHHYLTELKARGKAANSDHYPFSEAGVPAFFIYTMGGPGYYHDVDDTPDTVTFSRFTETFKLITEFMEGF